MFTFTDDSWNNIFTWLWFLVQVKYKEAGKKQTPASLYHRLPETLETQHAKEASQLQSQVGR